MKRKIDDVCSNKLIKTGEDSFALQENTCEPGTLSVSIDGVVSEVSRNIIFQSFESTTQIFICTTKNLLESNPDSSKCAKLGKTFTAILKITSELFGEKHATALHQMQSKLYQEHDQYSIFFNGDWVTMHKNVISVMTESDLQTMKQDMIQYLNAPRNEIQQAVIERSLHAINQSLTNRSTYNNFW